MQGMNRQEDVVKFLNQIQTVLLKVNIECCNACRKKVKKILEKIDGVFEITIDAEKGKVIVSGDVDAATLIKKLRKAGKHAELLPAKSRGSNYNNNINLVNNPHHDDIWKSQKGQQQPLLPQHHHHQQTKRLKDLKMPQLKNVKIPFRKDPKCVKSTPAPQGWDDENDDDEDNFDFFDMDLGDDFKRLKTKPTNERSNAGKKGVPGGGGSSVNCKKDGSSASGGQKGEGASTRNGNCRNNNMGGGKNDNVKREHPMMMNPNMRCQGFPPIDAVQMGNMQPPRAQTGNINPAALHGLPAGDTQAGRGAMRPPSEFVAAANMYQQQQYMAAMQQKQQQQQYMAAMQQKQQQQEQQQYMAAMQQQQRMMMLMMMNRQDGALHPTMLGHPPPETAVQYVPSMPPPGEPYTNMFSEENTSSCSIM